MANETNDSGSWSATRRNVGGVDLAVRETGEGPALIWGHGLLTSMSQEDEARVFDWSRCGAPMRWVRYDARGHGESAATYEPRDYEWPGLARDLLELATDLGERQAVFGGVSMGCATSLHAAVAEPDRVRALFLVGPPTAWETRARSARIYRTFSSVVGFTGLGLFRLIARFPLFGNEDSIVARMQKALIHHLAAADERAVEAALTGAADSDLPSPEELARLDIPALILCWPGDPIHPVSSAKQLAELLPHAELMIAEKLDDFRTWHERLRRFLETEVLSPPNQG
jgi:pimeloyl-ACP methyl ester carboxylesterase